MLEMTDKSTHQSAAVDEYAKPTSTQDLSIRETDVELQYPQILLEASFHSLLNHSVTSSSNSTIVPMPRAGAPLGESWATLSDTDLSRDDDLQSESTDLGSLIDAHNADDVHSMDEDGQTSDEEDDEIDHIHLRESAALHGEPFQYLERASSSVRSEPQDTTDPAEVIILDELSIFEDEDGYAASKRLTATTSVSMHMSRKRMRIGRQPLHIVVITSQAIREETKTEVLRKIGSVLVAAEGVSSLDTPLHYVIPAEFGPGSTADSAELIPVPFPIFVHECMVADIERGADGLYLLPINDTSVTYDSVNGIQIDDVDGRKHKPDIVLVLLSAGRGSTYQRKVRSLMSHIDHHCPLVIVKQESSLDPLDDHMHVNDKSIHKTLHKPLSQESEIQMPIDVATFLSLDSEQLSRHIQYSIDLRKRTHGSRASGVTAYWLALLAWLSASKTGWSLRSRSVFSIKDSQHGKEKDHFPAGNRHPRRISTTMKAAFQGPTAKLFAYALFATLISTLVYTSLFALIDTVTQPSVTEPRSISTTYDGAVESHVSTIPKPTIVVSSETPYTTREKSLLPYVYDSAQAWLDEELSRRGSNVRNQDQRRDQLTGLIKLCSTTKNAITVRRKSAVNLPESYFVNGDLVSSMKTVVSSGQNPLQFHLEQASMEEIILKVRHNISYETIDVAFQEDTNQQPICFRVTSSDTVFGAAAGIVLQQYSRYIRASDVGYINVLRLRSSKVEDASWATRFVSFTRQPVNFVNNVIERISAKREEALSKRNIRRLEHTSKQLRSKLHDSSDGIHCRARAVADTIRSSGENMLENVRSVMLKADAVSELVQVQQAKMSQTIGRAQNRARKLVHKARARRAKREHERRGIA